MSDGMRLFRASLREAIAVSLDYKPESAPSPSDLRLNEQLLNLFLPSNEPGSRLRRAIIMTLTNGHWWARGRIVHHCVGPHCCTGYDNCLQKISTFSSQQWQGQCRRCGHKLGGSVPSQQYNGWGCCRPSMGCLQMWYVAGLGWMSLRHLWI